MADLSPTRRALIAAEGEKRFYLIMALQYAEEMANSGDNPFSFERTSRGFRANMDGMRRAEAEMVRLAKQDLEELTSKPFVVQLHDVFSPSPAFQERAA